MFLKENKQIYCISLLQCYITKSSLIEKNLNFRNRKSNFFRISSMFQDCRIATVPVLKGFYLATMAIQIEE